MSDYLYKREHGHHLSGSYGRVNQHRKIAEEMLGRLLFSEEVVHHINEIKNDNRPENLMVFRTNDDHVRWHNIKPQDLSRLILQDDGSYTVTPRGKNGKMKPCEVCETPAWDKFCSDECSFKWSEKPTERPNKETLISLIIKHGFSKVGRMYHVSDNAIRDWCEVYNLPRTIRELKRMFISEHALQLPGASNSPGGITK